MEETKIWPVGQEWHAEDVVFRAERLRRRDAVRSTSDWHHVFAVMAALAHRYGDDGVRLIVWFDG
jgi:hypothetical protein